MSFARLGLVCRSEGWDLVFESSCRRQERRSMVSGRVVVVNKETGAYVTQAKSLNASEDLVIRDCCESILAKDKIRDIEFRRFRSKANLLKKAEDPLRRTESAREVDKEVPKEVVSRSASARTPTTLKNAEVSRLHRIPDAQPTPRKDTLSLPTLTPKKEKEEPTPTPKEAAPPPSVFSSPESKIKVATRRKWTTPLLIAKDDADVNWQASTARRTHNNKENDEIALGIQYTIRNDEEILATGAL